MESNRKFIIEIPQVLTILVDLVSRKMLLNFLLYKMLLLPFHRTTTPFHSIETPSWINSNFALETSTQIYIDPQSTKYKVFAGLIQTPKKKKFQGKNKTLVLNARLKKKSAYSKLEFYYALLFHYKMFSVENILN